MKFRRVNSKVFRLGITPLLVERLFENHWRVYFELDGKLYQGKNDFRTRKYAAQRYLSMAADPDKLAEFFKTEVHPNLLSEVTRKDLTFREELKNL